jgi:hypothetical protein
MIKGWRTLLTLAVVALVACVHVADSQTRGSAIPASTDQFKKGVTTIRDVQLVLGKPLSIIKNDDGTTILLYSQNTTTLSTHTSTSHATTFVFGPDEVLKDVSSRDTTVNF